MSEANKIKNPSDDKISKAIGKMIRTSPIKLNDAIKNIRGKKVGDALSHLEFSKKRISNEAKKILVWNDPFISFKRVTLFELRNCSDF
jgi:ribosomal protein L22